MPVHAHSPHLPDLAHSPHLPDPDIHTVSGQAYQKDVRVKRAARAMYAVKKGDSLMYRHTTLIL